MDHRSIFLNYDVFIPLTRLFILANGTDPDEMAPYATFYLGLHCLPRYLFTGIQNEMLKINVLSF